MSDIETITLNVGDGTVTLSQRRYEELCLQAESATRALTDLRERVAQALVWGQADRILALIDDAIAAQKGAS